jgi:concentrative nucleoside transporter, CNT family
MHSSLILQSALGILVMPFIAWCCSERREAIKISLLFYAIALQFGFAVLLTQIPWSQGIFAAINSCVLTLDTATKAGTGFVFGYLGGTGLPFEVNGNTSTFVLAFQALPLIIVLSALTALLTYTGILPLIISSLARFISRLLPLSAPTAFASAANIFVGMVESPLFVKPYLGAVSRSELFVIMTVGMATIAGTVMVIYVGFLQNVLDGAAGHLLTASIISIPAAIGIALTMVPTAEDPIADAPIPDVPGRENAKKDNPLGGDGKIGSDTSNSVNVNFRDQYSSAMDALVSGTQQGLHLCLQIAALLIVFIALVSLFNLVFGAVLPNFAGKPASLEGLLGMLFAPLAWLIGIPWSETQIAGQLLGVKTVLNEFIALRTLGILPASELSPRSVLIMSYALSGFANIGSLGILIGGLTTMVPERRIEIISLAPRAVVSGTLATLMTAAVIGVLN